MPDRDVLGQVPEEFPEEPRLPRTVARMQRAEVYGERSPEAAKRRAVARARAAGVAAWGQLLAANAAELSRRSEHEPLPEPKPIED